MSLGLPSFSMIFSGKAVSAIERSARGIVAMILTDGTEGGKDLNIYKKVDEVDFQNWTEQNYNYLKLVFAGAPSTVITIRRAENAEGYNAELKKLKDLKWNYLTIPGLGSADTTTISAWIKQYRDDERKTFKAVLAHCKGDHDGQKDAIRNAQSVLDELIGSLNFSYPISHNLYKLYMFCKNELSRAMYENRLDGVQEAEHIMHRLYTSFVEVAKQDKSAPLMKNTQQVYAGMTYARGAVNEDYMDVDSHRGFFV